MSDNPIITESDPEGNTSYSLRRRMEPAPHSLPYASGDFGSTIISLIKDFETKEVSMDSFSEGVSSNDFSGTLPLGNTGWGEDHVEKLMPPYVLTKKETKDAQ